MKKFKLSFILGVFLFASSYAEPKSSYYVVISSYEPSAGVFRPTKDGVFTHTFATFSKAEDGKVVEVKTISWGPCNGGRIRVFPPVSILLGCNKNLKQTLDKLAGFGRTMNAMAWGPIEITPSLYQAAAQRFSELRQLSDYERGTIISSRYEYAGIDWTERRKGLAKNCHHMVQDILEDVNGHVNPNDRSYGISAGVTTVKLFKRYFVTSSNSQFYDRHASIWEQIKALELENVSYPVLRFYEVNR